MTFSLQHRDFTVYFFFNNSVYREHFPNIFLLFLLRFCSVRLWMSYASFNRTRVLPRAQTNAIKRSLLRVLARYLASRGVSNYCAVNTTPAPTRQSTVPLTPPHVNHGPSQHIGPGEATRWKTRPDSSCFSHTLARPAPVALSRLLTCMCEKVKRRF